MNGMQNIHVGLSRSKLPVLLLIQHGVVLQDRIKRTASSDPRRSRSDCVRDGVLNNSFTFGVSEDVCISKPMNVNLPRLPGVPGFLLLWQRRGTTTPATHGTLGHSEDANTKKQTCSVQCD